MKEEVCMERLIFHVDVNSAFLSWEATRRVKQGLPDLREIPSCIGGDPRKRTGIVVAKSIPAKKYGIQTGEPMAMAFRKCPELISVPADFELYDKYSRSFKSICASYAPVMESFSIDEVFLDMTGTSYIYPDPIVTAHELKDKIRVICSSRERVSAPNGQPEPTIRSLYMPRAAASRMVKSTSSSQRSDSQGTCAKPSVSL